jgi:hypothetical protein
MQNKWYKVIKKYYNLYNKLKVQSLSIEKLIDYLFLMNIS